MKEYIEKNRDRFMSELFGLLEIPSVSALCEHKNDMEKCARAIAGLLSEAGADKADVYKTEGHPVVYGCRIIDDSLPTVLVYGHYDVQPAEPLDLWKTPPFEPEIRDGAIYARGSSDDKGQIFMHMKAFEYLVREKKQRHNIKFIFEGEEEVGSAHLAKWVGEHRDMLACDVVLVSDTTMISEDVPSVSCGMRGLSYMKVDVTGPDRDLHSGHYGGAILNPANVLCKMIGSLIDEDGRITIKGFYDDVAELSSSDREMLGHAPFDSKEFEHSVGVDAVSGEKGYTSLERIGIRPCLDVNGIWSGDTGEESTKTIIPSRAHAKISMRLVPNQKADVIAGLFEKHFKAIAPEGVSVKVSSIHSGNWFVVPISSSLYGAASKAIGEVYGTDTVPNRGGGSIPILADMHEILGADLLLMGFGLERDTIHSPNESFLLSQFFKGMESIALFYKYF